MNSIYDAWDCGDRYEIRNQFKKKEKLLNMAREAGIRVAGPMDTIDPKNLYIHELERFAALVAAAEREACAKVCDEGIQNATDWDSSYWDQACENRAAAIRAKGQA